MLFYATNFVVIRCLIHIENEYEWLWLRVTRKGVPNKEGLSGDRKEWRANKSQVHGKAKEDCWGGEHPGVGQCRGGASNVERRAWTRLQREELSVDRGQLYSQRAGVRIFKEEDRHSTPLCTGCLLWSEDWPRARKGGDKQKQSRGKSTRLYLYNVRC